MDSQSPEERSIVIPFTDRELAAIEEKSGGKLVEFAKSVILQASLKELRSRGRSGNRTHPTESAPAADDKSAAPPGRGQPSEHDEGQVAPAGGSLYGQSEFKHDVSGMIEPLDYSDAEKRWDALHAAYSNRHDNDMATRLLESLSTETDRGCVLVAAAILDLALKKLLTSFFRIRSGAKVEEINFFFEGQVPPLQSTSLKIRLARLTAYTVRPSISAAS